MSRPKTGGRQPGSTNVLTRSVKEALELAFDEMGGAPALVRWGKSNPSEFYRIWSRLLPKQIKAEVSEQPTGRIVLFLPDNGRGGPERTKRIMEAPGGQLDATAERIART